MSNQDRRVFIGLGSNLGDRFGYLRDAIRGLPDVRAVSRVYETEPIGGPEGQEPYLNAVVELATALSARGLFAVAQELEQDAGRTRSLPNAPRTLDVDILLVGHEQIDEPDLTVPHPRMWERRFVLAPLSDLAPELLPDSWEDHAAGDVRLIGTINT